jgi:hypothetical protein
MTGGQVLARLHPAKPDERILVQFATFDAADNTRLKDGAGGKWWKAEKTWWVPLDVTSCTALRRTFGDRLAVSGDLSAWYRKEQARRTSVLAMHASQTTQPVPVPQIAAEAPTIHRAMQARGYQTVVPAFAKAVGGKLFIADQPGTGKTIEIEGTLVECQAGQRVLIVAPSTSLVPTWRAQLEQWLGPDVRIRTWVCNDEVGTTAEREIQLLMYNCVTEPRGLHSNRRFEFLVINPEAIRIEAICPAGTCKGNSPRCENKGQHFKEPLHPALYDMAWDAIIMDETHKYMMNANERSASVSQVGLGIQKLPKRPDTLMIGASGTPFKGKPRRFWPVLHWLNPKKYTGQWKWQGRYFVMADDIWAASGKKPTEVMHPHMEQEFYDELGMIMIRRTKAELRALNPAWAPPDKVHVRIGLEMTPQQKRVYALLFTAGVVQLEGGQLFANGVLAIMTRAKQFATSTGKMTKAEAKNVATSNDLPDPTRFVPSLPSCKWNWIKNSFLEERGILDGDNENPIKVVIASQYVQMLDMMAAELAKLKVPYEIIKGGPQRAGYRASDVAARWQRPWQEGDARVLLLSTMAGGTSLTLDAADDLVLCDETFVPDDQEQVEDRIHRTGRTDHQVTIYHLITEDTIDASIYDGNLGMDEIQKRALDGRRGVNYLRNVLEGKAS